VPNGIDPTRFRVKYAHEGYFVYVGRLSREKGLYTLIEAARRVAMPLRIVGDGPERSAVQEYITALGRSNISLEGHKSGADLQAIVAGAAFVVVPSEWYENAPMSILEAMACGKPVIGSRIGGIPEQVEDAVTGILFESGNSDALLAAIRTLASDEERRRAMGHAARARVEQEFSLDLHCTRLIEVYKEAIGG
jgi:glycosyltransferase involved in cell wall biosynthesis